LADPGTATLTLSLVSSPGTKDSVKMTVFKVVDVEWDTFEDNTPLDPDTTTNLGSLRIFPDRQSYNDESTTRAQVWLRGHISPAPGNHPWSRVNVDVRSWDVDDPSADCWVPPVDVLPKDVFGECVPFAGPDNRDALVGGGILLSTVPVIADADGSFAAKLQVSMRPGDNYAAGATTTPEIIGLGHYLETLPDVDALMPNGGNLYGGHVKVTQMLTVWRRLWIEQDTMPQLLSCDPYTTGTATSQLSPISPTNPLTRVFVGQNFSGEGIAENVFEVPGHIVFSACPAGSNDYPVWFSSDKLVGEDYVDISVFGDPLPPCAFEGYYELFDDDDTSVLPWYPKVLSDPFRAAYIEPTYEATAFRTIVPRDPYVSTYELYTGAGSWNDGMTLPAWEGPDFWVCPLVSAFQGPPSEDGDPMADEATHGVTADGQAVLFLEVIREGGGNREWTAAHECGHVGGLEDDREGPPSLMNDQDPTDYFKPEDIAALRDNQTF
ncbi:MAG: hypothetical protein ACUVXJ_19420, partial [Phycisphaerae bacterium]